MIKICDPGIQTKYNVADFERAIADFVGYPFAVATNTGTAALHLAILAMLELNVMSPEKVSVSIPNICFRAVLNAVVAAGCKVNHSQDSKYRIDVMNYGFPCEKRGQILDASEALGGNIPTDYDFVTLSFNWNKPITCGSGGMVLCKSPKMVWNMRLWANQAKLSGEYFLHTGPPGFNYRMNDLQATMGMESLYAWPLIYSRKSEINAIYIAEGLPLVHPPADFNWNKWITLLRTPKRDKVIRAFRENDIEVRCMFYPNTEEVPKDSLFAAETLCLPSSPGLTEEEQAKVIQVVKEVL